MKADGELPPARPAFAQTTDVARGPRGEIVWRPLAEAWLTNKVVQNFELHVKGGYAWNASRYLPVFVVDEDGDAFLSFRKR